MKAAFSFAGPLCALTLLASPALAQEGASELRWQDSPLSGNNIGAVATLGTTVSEAESALNCPRRRLGDGLEATGFDCRLEGTIETTIGGRRVIAASLYASWDHDGLHGETDAIVLRDEETGTVLAVFESARHEVDDPDTTLRLRRIAPSSSDGVFCVEEVFEIGPGAYAEGVDETWTPRADERHISAWAWQGDQILPSMATCPTEGYELFNPAQREFSFGARLDVQGERADRASSWAPPAGWQTRVTSTADTWFSATAPVATIEGTAYLVVAQDWDPFDGAHPALPADHGFSLTDPELLEPRIDLVDPSLWTPAARALLVGESSCLAELGAPVAIAAPHRTLVVGLPIRGCVVDPGLAPIALISRHGYVPAGLSFLKVEHFAHPFDALGEFDRNLIELARELQSEVDLEHEVEDIDSGVVAMVRHDPEGGPTLVSIGEEWPSPGADPCEDPARSYYIAFEFVDWQTTRVFRHAEAEFSTAGGDASTLIYRGTISSDDGETLYVFDNGIYSELWVLEGGSWSIRVRVQQFWRPGFLDEPDADRTPPATAALCDRS